MVWRSGRVRDSGTGGLPARSAVTDTVCWLALHGTNFRISAGLDHGFKLVLQEVEIHSR